LLELGWPSDAGLPPTEFEVNRALILGAKAGTKVGLAWALYCRPSGATHAEVISVCGGPQRNKAAEAAQLGMLSFTSRQRPDGSFAHYMQPPNEDYESTLAVPHNPGGTEGANCADPSKSTRSTQAAVMPSMNTVLKKPAARVQQGDLTLYATALKVRELVSTGFYSVETLDPENPDDQGYQRLLNRGRAKKVADYVLKGQEKKDAFLPTSIFMATSAKIDFDTSTNTIIIDKTIACPLSVVDGQHRLEGLKLAAEKDPRVLDFEIPVNIAADLPKLAQMCHFLIVNSTQKAVDRSVEQRIISRLTEALDLEDVPSLPKWIQNIVDRGEVDKSTRIVDYLNEAPGSPWEGKIKMANDESRGSTLKQHSFVKAIVKYILTPSNPITIYKDTDKEKKIFLNFWKAIANIIDDGDSETLYKYNGIELFCRFSIPFFMRVQNEGNDFTVGGMEMLLRACFENVEGDYAGVGHPEWWKTGGQAGRLNAGALGIIVQEMTQALNRSSLDNSSDIRL
jgi:DGQHR domain-containing protein